MIKALAFRNAGPFRGEHVLELRPLAYALTARYAKDPGRSNWGGKSFLLELVRFALTGGFPKPRAADWAARGWGAADGWLSEGAKEGAVSLVFEDGSVVKRERRRGKPTQVAFSSAAGKATQAEADAAVLRHVGFSEEDYQNVAYFEQGEMKRLVRMQPERRFDVVRGWLGLEKAEAAEDRAGKLASAAVRDLRDARSRRDSLRRMIDELGELPDEGELAAAVEAAGARVDRALSGFRLREKHKEAARTAAAFDAVVEEGKRLAAEGEKIPPGAEERAAEADRRFGETAGEYAELDKEVARRKKVSLGLFDGVCPVADIECPAKERINADRGPAVEALRAAEKKRDAAAAAYEAARREKDAARGDANAAGYRAAELARLREEARGLLPEAKEARKLLKKSPPPPDDGEHGLSGLRSLHNEALSAAADARARRAQKERLEAQLAEAEDALREAEKASSASLAARNVFRGAQRRISERALDQISARAGAMLMESGIDLSVAVRWEREGKDLARACELCGAAFPASARVKECASCGAERALSTVQKLEFLLSDRSGAAEDLAGAALQLAAGAWILRARNSPWATAVLDEPLAQCDKTNRRALAGQLARLLASGTWRQAVMISHSPETVDMFPGRIEIVVEKDGRRRLVTS